MAKKAKKAANGSGSIRKRSDGTWEGRFTVGIHPGTGKAIRKSVYGKTQAEVAERLRSITAGIDTNGYFEPSKITLREWFEVWLRDYMISAKPLTVRQYTSMAETHILPALGAVKLSKLTSPQIQKFYNQLAKEGKASKRKNPLTGKMETYKTGEPLSPKTIRNIHDILNKSLNTAIEQGMLKENPALRTSIPKVIKKEIKPLTEEQQKAFLEAIDNHEFKNLYILILFTGLRESESCGLTWNCFDEKAGTLKVYRQLQRVPGEWSTFRFVPLKNNRTRTIKLSPYMVGLLKKQWLRQTEQRFAAGDEWKGWKNEEEKKTGYIFTNAEGCFLNSATVYENYKRIVRDIGVPEARVHDLRHTFAVNSLQCGDDIKTLQENLGHASASTTLNVYAHVSEKMKEESAKRQQAYIESLGIRA